MNDQAAAMAQQSAPKTFADGIDAGIKMEKLERSMLQDLESYAYPEGQSQYREALRRAFSLGRELERKLSAFRRGAL